MIVTEYWKAHLVLKCLDVFIPPVRHMDQGIEMPSAKLEDQIGNWSWLYISRPDARRALGSLTTPKYFRVRGNDWWEESEPMPLGEEIWASF